MPLQFYTSQNQLSNAEKLELVSTLTDFYAEIMPEFFVNIVFNEVRSISHLSYVTDHRSIRQETSSWEGSRQMEILSDSQPTISL